MKRRKIEINDLFHLHDGDYIVFYKVDGEDRKGISLRELLQFWEWIKKKVNML